MGTKLSNVIGAPFQDYVLDQLYTRATNNSTVNRTNDQVLFLANKTAWVRLVSSVDISIQDETERKKFYGALELPDLGAGSYLASNWILEAGTSKQNRLGLNYFPGTTLRQGIGPDGAYGLGGTEELGYRPMPGLTSVNIQTMGKLGSLRQATIDFKVWNINQLNVIEALYFRLGYTMLLEWGHVQYYKNNGEFIKTLVTGIGNPFVQSLDKETVQQTIAEKQRQEDGNYGGMLGMVSNFNWSFNQDGGYDCMVRIIGLGATIDSTRTNQIYTLPEGLARDYKKYQNDLQRLRDEIAAREAALANAQNPTETRELGARPTTVAELLATAKKDDGATDISSSTFNKASSAYDLGIQAEQLAPDYYYVPKGISTDDPAYVTKLKEQNEGLYLTRANTNGNFSLFVKPGTSVGIGVADLEAYIKEYVLSPFSDGAYSEDTQYPDQTNLAKAYTRQARYPFNRVTLRSFLPTAQANETLGIGKPVIINYYRQGKPFLPYFFSVEVQITPGGENHIPKVFQVADALDAWELGGAQQSDIYEANSRATLENISIEVKEVNGEKRPVITGTSRVKIKQVTYTGPATTNIQEVTKDIEIIFKFQTNDTGLIATAGPAPQITNLKSQTPQTANTGDNNAAENSSTPQQEDSTEGLESALQAMLVIVRSKAWSRAQTFEVKDTSTYLSEIPILDLTEKFYKDGALNGTITSREEVQRRKKVNVITQTPSVVAGPNGLPFDLVQYGLKGFNSELMADKKKFDAVPTVNFEALCKAYLVRYPRVTMLGERDMLTSPTYITFGYLLAFLNNMCVLYNSTVPVEQSGKGQKRPFVYIDFNTETNFCLTSEQQLSVDPNVCLIPFNCSDQGYKDLFPSEVKLDPIFQPQKENVVTALLTKNKYSFQTNFTNKATGLPYQGKVMNILLNIDYLLDTCKQYITSDPEHSLNLQPFLERILVDVNKCLGNINLFRLAYRDETNTVQIVDDQWVPNLQEETTGTSNPAPAEPSILAETAANTKTGTGRLPGQLPLFVKATSAAPGEVPVGGLSLLRDFQFRTEMSAKLASMIAISAQAATGSVNAKDHSSLSWMNKNYKDRFIPYKQDPSNGKQGSNNSTSDTDKSNDQKAAEMFNTHIATIYSGVDAFTPDNVEQAKNYYIERMSKIKSADSLTSAAPFIPANLEFTIDGISGILMGNAFTIPNDRLPYSLRGENGTTKVGFVVTGLTHMIENNEWLTRVVGQMIKLRPNVKIFKKPPTREEVQARGAVAEATTSTGFCTRQASDEIASAAANITILKNTARANGLTSKYAIASLLAIAGGESGWNPRLEESFKYTSERLSAVFPNLTQDQKTRALNAPDRKTFFSIVYGEYAPSRVGNRNVEDGGKYYGRGFIQLTGYGNYQKYGALIKEDLVNNPDLASDPTIAAKIAVAYFKDRIKEDQNSPNYFQVAVPAVGNAVDPQKKANYYQCLLGQV